MGRHVATSTIYLLIRHTSLPALVRFLLIAPLSFFPFTLLSLIWSFDLIMFRCSQSFPNKRYEWATAEIRVVVGSPTAPSERPYFVKCFVSQSGTIFSSNQSLTVENLRPTVLLSSPTSFLLPGELDGIETPELRRWRHRLSQSLEQALEECWSLWEGMHTVHN